MTEARYAAKLLPALRAIGAWAVKIHGGAFQQAGLPDILGCYRGGFFALELKQCGKKLTLQQISTLSMLCAAGGRACVIYTDEPVEEVVEWVKSSAF